MWLFILVTIYTVLLSQLLVFTVNTMGMNRLKGAIYRVGMAENKVL